MLFVWIVISIIFLAFIIGEAYSHKSFVNEQKAKNEKLSENCDTLKRRADSLQQDLEKFEKKITEHFYFYELARRISPLLDRKKLFDVFCTEVKYLFSDVEDIIVCSRPRQEEGYFNFPIEEGESEVLCVKSKSKIVIEYLSNFAKLLRLCVERITLYERLQQLSIYDSLTSTYNRRYFTQRYLEEFERAKKFKLNLSFLMVDIDHFKKINDNYGHLVGDVVLREVASIIAENLREIDFVARYGGEEFSIILLETDKAGAIMVAERIRSKISSERIKAFDETIHANISIGIGAYPQNTLHSDVLIEVADKALYKAKVSGRNRICWF